MVQHASANVIVMQSVRLGLMGSAQALVSADTTVSGIRRAKLTSRRILHAADVVSLLPWLTTSFRTRAI